MAQDSPGGLGSAGIFYFHSVSASAVASMKAALASHFKLHLGSATDTPQKLPSVVECM